jgi:hypothetical protein
MLETYISRPLQANLPATLPCYASS